MEVLAFDVFAILHALEEGRLIGNNVHLYGYIIGAGVAMHCGILKSSQRRGGGLATPRISSNSLFGLTSKGVLGERNVVDRNLTRATATQFFVRACGMPGFCRLMSFKLRPNKKVMDE